MKRNRFLIALAGTVAFAAGTLALVPAANAHSMSDMNDTNSSSTSSSSGGSVVDLIRAAVATAAFNSPEIARRAGYDTVVEDKDHITCIAEPGVGAMGEHHLKPALLDDSVEVTKPELLVYEPDGAGHLRLVALEYLVNQAAWEATHSGKPRLFGQDFMLTGPGNRFGLDPFYSLHVWIWKFNPRGVFDMWNPRVNCPA